MNRFQGLLLPFLFALSAPAAAAGQVALAVQGGVTLARLDATGPDDYSDGSRWGGHLGGSVTLPVSTTWGLQLGGAYLQKGASIGILADDIVDGFFVDLKLDYLELSALAKASRPTGFGSVHLMGGPTVAFERSCTTDLTYSPGGDTVESDSGQDYSDVPCTERDYGIGADDTKAVEFGFAGGIGAELPLAPWMNATLDLLYGRGLSAVMDGIKNAAFTLRAGISVPIG